MKAIVSLAVKNFVVQWAVFPILLALTVMIPNIGNYEGDYFPVIKNFEIVSRKATVDDRVEITFLYDKVRDCKIVASVWSVNTARKYWTQFDVFTPFSGEEVKRTRTVGSWESTVVMAAPSTFKDSPMMITFYHDCWGPLFWTTQTIAVKQPTQSEAK